MKFGLSLIFEQLHITKIQEHYNRDAFVNYYGIRWLYGTEEMLAPLQIYIGPASNLPKNLPKQDRGIIVQNDNNRDFSQETVEIAILDNEINLAKLCLQIQDTFFRIQEMLESSSILFEQILTSRSVKEIIDIAYAHLKNPILLNYSFPEKMVLYAGPNVSSVRQLPNQPVPPLNQDFRLLQNMLGSPIPRYFEDGAYFPGCRRLNIPLTKGADCSDAIGVLSCFEGETPFTPQTEAYLSMIAHVLSQRAKLYGFQNELLASRYEQKIQDLISGKRVDGDVSWLDVISGRLYQNFIVAVMDVRNINSLQLDQLKFMILQNIIFCVTVPRGSYLVVLANMRTYADRPKLIALLQEIVQKYHLPVGISGCFAKIGQLSRYYQQAKLAREVGIAGRPEDLVFDFDYMKANILLYEHAGDLRLYYSDDMLRLQEYDRAENTEYCETLRVYLACGMNREQTRLKLNAHRNTLPYRLARIEEILGHSLTDGKYLLGLYLADLAASMDEQKKTQQKS